jgi:hypothetical protein
MHEWVRVQLSEAAGKDADKRESWWITLKWYFGFCAKRELGDPTNREHGKIFWREAVLPRNPAEWQKAQWGASLKWFFDELAGKDQAGPSMRRAIRR